MSNSNDRRKTRISWIREDDGAWYMITSMESLQEDANQFMVEKRASDFFCIVGPDEEKTAETIKEAKAACEEMFREWRY